MAMKWSTHGTATVRHPPEDASKRWQIQTVQGEHVLAVHANQSEQNQMERREFPSGTWAHAG